MTRLGIAAVSLFGQGSAIAVTPASPEGLPKRSSAVSRWRTTTTLKRASASRPSGEWRDDDYDMLAQGEAVGRIFNANAAPGDRRGCGC
jgi:hypothetical protein